MNSPAYDMAIVLEAAGLGSLDLGTLLPGAGVGLAVGEEPPEPSEMITLYSYGGTAEEGISLNCSPLDSFRMQVRVRARSYGAAYAMIQQVEDKLNMLKNHSVKDGTRTVWYTVTYRLQPPMENGFDERKRFIFTQNYAGLRQRI